MKNFFITLILLTGISTSKVFSQADFSAITIGPVYSIHNRPGLAKYLHAISDTMHLKNDLQYNPNPGLQIGFLSRANKGEFEVEASYSYNRNEVNSDSGYILISNTHDFGMCFGGNFVPVKFFFIGGQLVINSFGGNTKGGDANKFQLPADTDFNIFRGYSIVLRTQAGFIIPFNSDWSSGMRPFVFYDYGLTTFNFYTSFDHQLVAYPGSKRTGSTGYGLGLMFYL